MAGLSTALRWAVVIAALEPVEGHEQGGQRRCLVVSYGPFHRSGLVTVCPITGARADARYPGDVPIPNGEAGQTRAGVILCQQLRTISSGRLAGAPIGWVTDPGLRRQVRQALAHHLALDVPGPADGAETISLR